MNLYDIDIKFVLISKQYRLIVFLYPRWLEFTSENTRRSVIGKSHDKCWSIQNQTIDPLLSYPSNHGGHSGGHTEAFSKNFFWFRVFIEKHFWNMTALKNCPEKKFVSTPELSSISNLERFYMEKDMKGREGESYSSYINNRFQLRSFGIIFRISEKCWK